MTRPTGAIVWMLVFLAAVAALCSVVFEPLRGVFVANPGFNGVILAVLLAGILVNFRQVIDLRREIAWIDEFRRDGRDGMPTPEPRLLAPMARMLGRRDRGSFTLSALSMRSLLDSIRSRLEEARDVGRYMTGLLIFLGLLGTFWGLLTTVAAVSDVIGGLSGTAGDGVASFDALKAGLQQPLSGMGTAFSSSLFGLSGALVLGFLDLRAGHAQNRFFNELEEWLSSVTNLTSGALVGEAEGNLTAYVQALLEQTADSLDRLRRTLSESEQERRITSDRMLAVTEQVAKLTDQMHAELGILRTLGNHQADLKPILRQLAEKPSGLDEASRVHLRNLDVAVSRIRDESGAASEQIVQEVRNELRVLSRTVAAAASGRRVVPPQDPLD